MTEEAMQTTNENSIELINTNKEVEIITNNKLTFGCKSFNPNLFCVWLCCILQIIESKDPFFGLF